MAGTGLRHPGAARGAIANRGRVRGGGQEFEAFVALDDFGHLAFRDEVVGEFSLARADLHVFEEADFDAMFGGKANEVHDLVVVHAF